MSTNSPHVRKPTAKLPADPASETLVILDYGSQYTQFIARQARELGVYSIILPFDVGLAEIRRHKPHGIVLSGGPSSVYEAGAPGVDAGVFDLGIPVLGVCYGLHLITQLFGGKVESSAIREYGRANLELAEPSKILTATVNDSTVWMSHGDHVRTVPPDFTITATSGPLIAAIEHATKPIFGLQFHLEVAQTEHGGHMLEQFIRLCGFKQDWVPEALIDRQVKLIREQVGSANVICALSGGVDSSVAATLVNSAIGKQQTCIFVDTGLLRKNEF
jgi:GMP synthase (glutamine-hydrolysing)